MRFKNSKGVTLIELLMVVGIIAIIAVIGGDILLSVIRAYEKARTLGEVEQNGTFASTLLENKLRNSANIKVCDSGTCENVDEDTLVNSNYIEIIDAKDGSKERLGLSGDCGSITIDGGAITNNSVKIKGLSGGFLFTVFDPVNNPPVVSVSFRVLNDCTLPNPTTIDFNTTVTLRGGYGN